MLEKETNLDETTKLYELGVNLVPTLEDKTETEFDSLKKIIEKEGGKIESFSSPESIPLAYTMAVTVDSKKQKHNTASFGWIKFISTPESISKIKEAVDSNNNVLRYVILKTTEEASTGAKEIADFLNKPIKEKDASVKGSKKKDIKEEDNVEEEIQDIDEGLVEEAFEESVEKQVDDAIEELISENK